MATAPLILLGLAFAVFATGNGDNTVAIAKLELGSGLTGQQKLKSAKGTFAFGLFDLGSKSRWYAGVWIDDVRNKSKIWIANRERPAGINASLQLQRDGNLLLSNPNGLIIWSSGTQGKDVTSLELLENGNLVLVAAGMSNGTIWQSFDHPGNSWVPGMRMYLGTNLTSWKSVDDPSPGRYSLKMKVDTEFVSEWMGSTEYWTSGRWDGEKFVDVPELKQDYIYNFTFTNDSRGPYFTWFQVHDSPGKLRSRFIIEEDGVIRVHIWVESQWATIWEQPKDGCSVERVCGSFGICGTSSRPCSCPSGFHPASPLDWALMDWSLGCVPDLGIACNAKHTFVSLPNTYFGGSVRGIKSYASRDEAFCHKLCKEDCSCTAYAFDSFAGNCSLYLGDPFNGKTSAALSVTTFLKVYAHTSRKKLSKFVMYVCMAIAFILLFAIGSFLTIHKRKRRDYYVEGELTVFSYKDLIAATSNFKEKLGSGGFGVVYMGWLADNTPVAVKKVERLSEGEREFRAEVNTIGKIQHVNLVRLMGFCAHRSQRLLVYEFLPNGSLNSCLFDSQGICLDWETRFNIALGISRGLCYLHDECLGRIIHCDIKPENVLLDKNLRAKVCDFGLAKLVGREFSKVITTLKGTRGYLAPEWLSNMPITPKVDVFSFGMTLLEIISGRRNMDGHKTFFPWWASQQLKVGEVAPLADFRLNGIFDVQQLERALKVGMWCIQDETERRPTMAQVVRMLEGNMIVDDPPTPTSYNRIFDIVS